MITLKAPYIVVTGGAGLIGSSIIRVLNDQMKGNIIVVDELDSTEKWKNLVGKSFVDILHKDQLFDWLEVHTSEVSAIIHLGACSATTEKNAGFLLENNYRYTLKLAEFALQQDVRFIYASSAATYGDGSLGFSDDHSMLESLRPLNMYGYSKHLFDLWAYRQGVLDNFVGLKYFNVYGPNEYHKGRMCSAVVKWVKEIKETGQVKLFASDKPNLYADGEQKRDFVYVKDAAKQTVSFLENSAGGIYNIATGEAKSWNRLAKAVFHALDKPVSIEYIEMPDDLKGKYQYFTQAEMSKTKKALQDAYVETHFEEAVLDYVQNYLVQDAIW